MEAPTLGNRLDRFLADALPELSRTRLKTLVQSGLVTVGGATITEPSHRVKPGQTVAVAVPPAEPATPRAQAMDLAVAFEDDHLIVIDKPAGLVVHPAPGNPDRTLVNALLAHCGDSLSGIGGVRRPGIVHRLDKDTSGLMVAAKSDAAHAALARQLAERTLTRLYHAVVWGVLLPRHGTIDQPIGRDPRNRKRMAIATRSGKPSVTHYRTLKIFGPASDPVASLVECRLETGRTHQIRVHLASLGHGLVGDPVYGRPPKGRLARLPTPLRAAVADFHRQALHAIGLRLAHPGDSRDLTFKSSYPSDMEVLISCFDKF